MIYFAVNFANLTISQAHNYNSLDLEMSLQNTKVCYMVVICFIGMIRTLCFKRQAPFRIICIYTRHIILLNSSPHVHPSVITSIVVVVVLKS